MSPFLLGDLSACLLIGRKPSVHLFRTFRSQTADPSASPTIRSYAASVCGLMPLETGIKNKAPILIFLRTRAKSRVTTLFHRQLTLPASSGTAYPDLITGVTRRSLLDFVRCGAPGCIRKRVLRAPLINRLLSVRSVCSYLFPSRLCHSV